MKGLVPLELVYRVSGYKYKDLNKNNQGFRLLSRLKLQWKKSKVVVRSFSKPGISVNITWNTNIVKGKIVTFYCGAVCCSVCWTFHNRKKAVTLVDTGVQRSWSCGILISNSQLFVMNQASRGGQAGMPVPLIPLSLDTGVRRWDRWREKLKNKHMADTAQRTKSAV